MKRSLTNQLFLKQLCTLKMNEGSDQLGHLSVDSRIISQLLRIEPKGRQRGQRTSIAGMSSPHDMSVRL